MRGMSSGLELHADTEILFVFFLCVLFLWLVARYKISRLFRTHIQSYNACGYRYVRLRLKEAVYISHFAVLSRAPNFPYAHSVSCSLRDFVEYLGDN